MTLLPELDRRTRASRVVRWVGLGVAAASAAGLVALSSPAPARAADDSALTVAWKGGNAEAVQKYQPARDTASVHYADFQNVKVTVDRTQDLVDEALSVTVSGMAGQTQAYRDNGGLVFDFGSNFVQAMQCWGDPADPKFYENCEWGAYAYGSGTVPKTVQGSANSGMFSANGRGTSSFDVPFRAVTGTEYTSLPWVTNSKAAVLQVFAPQNTNERTALVDSSGVANFEFEAQSAASQPYLGCGNESSATGTRCWLVIVPRGAHNSRPHDNCRTALPDPAQEGGPINPACDYWANRVVVPLDFRSTGVTCQAGSAERRAIGTDRIQAAFSSWQTALCRQSGTVYSLTTSADPLARQQLLNGQAQLVFTSEPLTADTLGNNPAAVDTLDQTDLAYAPVAISAVTIAYLANNQGTLTTDLRLTPRLVAKMLTQSYALEQGLHFYTTKPTTGPWATNPFRLSDDPEFKALNPDAHVTPGGTFVITGPNASDAVAQLWAYVQSDEAARAFLSGEPDNVRPGDEHNSGMTLNPFYLPRGSPGARVPVYSDVDANGNRNMFPDFSGNPRPTLLPKLDAQGNQEWQDVGLTHDDGSPMCLCDAPVDVVQRYDTTQRPQQLSYQNQTERFDSVQALPYAATLEAAAQRVFHADTGALTLWNIGKVNGVGIPDGGYVDEGLSLPTNAFLMGFTDAAGAARYALPTAALQVPNEPGHFVSADPAAMTTAVEARTPTDVAGVDEVDVKQLPDYAYPLTSVIYAAVNLTTTNKAARTDYANLIQYAATDGQQLGHSIGQLPVGYLPLPKDLRTQATAAADAIRAYTAPSEDPAPTTDPGEQTTDQSLADTASSNVATSNDSAATAPAPEPAATDDVPQTQYTPEPTADASATPAIQGSAASGALGGTLVVGLAGAVAGPVLLRRRGGMP